MIIMIILYYTLIVPVNFEYWKLLNSDVIKFINIHKSLFSSFELDFFFQKSHYLIIFKLKHLVENMC